MSPKTTPMAPTASPSRPALCVAGWSGLPPCGLGEPCCSVSTSVEGADESLTRPVCPLLWSLRRPARPVVDLDHDHWSVRRPLTVLRVPLDERGEVVGLVDA